MAEWRPVSTSIAVADNVITVQEVVGIELKIQIDKIQNINGSTFYTFQYNGQDNVRMGHSKPMPDGKYIVTVLRDNYQCFLKENQ